MDQLSVGQVWVCDATQDVPPLMCIIGTIEDISARDEVEHRVISTTVRPHPKCDPIAWKTIWHMPVTEVAFQSSGLRLTTHQGVLSKTFWSGHAIWSAKYKAGEAGVFSDPVGRAYLWGLEAARESSSNT